MCTGREGRGYIPEEKKVCEGGLQQPQLHNKREPNSLGSSLVGLAETMVASVEVFTNSLLMKTCVMGVFQRGIEGEKVAVVQLL